MGDNDQLTFLTELSNRAVLEFEETQKKCKEFYSKYCQQHDRSQKLEAQFKQLKRVSLLAVSEYENLMKRYTDEVKQKDDALRNLKKIEEENKEIRKANKLAPNVAIIPSSSDKGTNDGATKGELEGLRSLLTGIKDEIRRSKSQVSKLEEQLAEEKRDHESTKQKLKIANAQVQQLNRVSVMALDEFQELRKKYEAEVECRKNAEEYATKLLNDNQNIARKSKMINDVAPVNEKLERALKEIDDLNDTLSKERAEHTRKIKDIQEEIDASADTEALKALEEKMSVTLDQIELLQTQLHDSEERGQESEKRARELYNKLIRTEEALMSSANPSAVSLGPPTPAPPAPPPPPIPPPMIRKFITRIGGGKKKRTVNGKEKDDPVQDMMKEMMSRIKKGVHLKSQAQKEDDSSSPAMNELASLLTNLKRGQGGREQVAAETEKEKVPEFQKFKLKKVSVTQDRSKLQQQQQDNELLRKLGKQKLAAEGEAAKEGRVSTSGEFASTSENSSTPAGNSTSDENRVVSSVKEEEKEDEQNKEEKGDREFKEERGDNQNKEEGGKEDSSTPSKEAHQQPSDVYENLHDISKEVGNEEAAGRGIKEESNEVVDDTPDRDTGITEKQSVNTEKVEKVENERNAASADGSKEQQAGSGDGVDKSLDEIFDELNQFLG